MPVCVYTVGHSNHTQAAFLDLLRLHKIEVLIDTRSAPYSRFAPQFNREALKAAIVKQGLKYGFYGRELGGRPEGEDFYDAQGHVLYSAVALSPLFQEGLARLLSGAEKYRVALLCSEEDPNVCHRRLLVARVLEGLGVEVSHIRGDGRLESECELRAAEMQQKAAQPSLFDVDEEAQAWRSLQSVSRKAPPPTSSGG
jgi:uncharacterized protein (DUF488 family)